MLPFQLVWRIDFLTFTSYYLSSNKYLQFPKNYSQKKSNAMCGPRQEMQQRYSPGTLPITNWKEVEFHCQWRRTSSATVYFICNCIFYQKRAPFSRHTVRFVPLFQRVFMQSYLFSSCRAAGLVLWFLVFIKKKIREKLLSYFVCSEESSSVQFAGQITTTLVMSTS